MDWANARIGVIGTGAIGAYYGVLLARAGADVHFLLRSDFAAAQRQGLLIEHAQQGELHLQPAQVYQRASDMPRCDVLLVCCKTTANQQMLPLIEQVAAPGAAVVLMQNGYAVEDQLRAGLSADLHLLAGLCFICVHRKAAAVICHQAYGGVNLAYHSGPAGANAAAGQGLAQALSARFVAAGIDSHVLPDVATARWQKLVWNIPYNGLSVLLDASTGELMKNAASRSLIARLMHEVVQAANACGCDLPVALVEKMLAATDRMPDYYPSMYHDYAQQRVLELEAIYAAPLAAAQASGVSMPAVAMLLDCLRFKTTTEA
ncbi:putative 2-dehydropantoate 2-reductase [Atopomonas sediminilitoris]|uniref:putative 2-dehydropantoate 2-reductase n=1 Tax=Atopomonas sediminilitoris TaxID=2919919 RepID=UPI001F4DB78E|nr:putative 2-dehydropantoate 2-reductase [Atopomonas sediminilitoris]MCJ8167801.1 putative 2-dehydropantoate 2-reductase [Atopomonas sediminilitoris]